MSIPRMSPEERAFIALSSRIEAGDLTLEQVREIEDEALLQLTKTTREVGQKFFARLGEVKQGLVEEKAADLERDGSLISRIEALKLRMSFLDPEEIQGRLSLLEREVALEEGGSEKATKALEDLRFFFEKPIAQELDSKSSDFYTSVKAVADRCLKENSLGFARAHLSSAQLRNIMGRGG